MRIAKIREVKTPTRGTSGSAGLDFYIPEDFRGRHVHPNCAINIPSGIVAQIPEGLALVALNKSGVARDYDLQVGACLVDQDYQGEIHLHFFNVGVNSVWLCPGMKIAQFVLVPIVKTDVQEVPFNELFTGDTERGTGGFGSTGRE